MSRIGIDYAWGTPHIDALKRAGITFVCRYLSHDPSKNLNPFEHDALRAHDIDVHVAWETTAERARDDRIAGRADAIEAHRQAEACGLPSTEPIYMAIDFDAEGPEVAEYFKGALEILGDRTGAYGGYRPLKWLFDHQLIHHGWQAYAWSNGQWDPRALLRQYSNDHTLDGVSVDYDVDIAPHATYVPADEHNWIREYDRLHQQKRAPWRRTWLRHTMTSRRKKIWHLAQHTGWTTLNRAERYRQLLLRTE